MSEALDPFSMTQEPVTGIHILVQVILLTPCPHHTCGSHAQVGVPSHTQQVMLQTKTLAQVSLVPSMEAGHPRTV